MLQKICVVLLIHRKIAGFFFIILTVSTHQIYEQLEEEEKKMKAKTVKMECCLKGVLHEVFLQKYILLKHWTGLYQHIVSPSK